MRFDPDDGKPALEDLSGGVYRWFNSYEDAERAVNDHYNRAMHDYVQTLSKEG